MNDIPPALLKKVRAHRQEHVLLGWEKFDARRRGDLIRQLEAIDLDEIARLYSDRDHPSGVPTADRLTPIPTERTSEVDASTIALGRESLANGELAVLLVAGGQGTRLGFDHPKGMFPIGPVSNKTLFEIHTDKVFALVRRYGKPVPFLVMTSPATHDETEEYFREKQYFGLGRENVIFFQQGTMPAVDLATGQLLLEAVGVLFTSPNGHGGTLTALSDSGLLAELEKRGIRHLFYFQVDNPLVKIGDPAFLGRHIALQAEASSKAIAKAFPKEKMGVFALIDGRCGIVEYSDLPEELAHASRDGRLVYGSGSPAIHLFDVGFLKRITEGKKKLPFHFARKKVPYVSDTGEAIDPTTENALKFEMFIFDSLPMADRYLVMESPREEEFSPVKNASGVDSPATCHRDLSNLAGVWLEKAGVKVPRNQEGHVSLPLEISPRFAFDAAELTAKIGTRRTIESATYFE